MTAPFVLDGICMSGNIYGDVLGVSTKEQIKAQQGVIYAGIWLAYAGAYRMSILWTKQYE